MNTIPKELSAIPGVIGVYVFHTNDGISASEVPPIFSENELTDIARMLVKIYDTGTANMTDLSEITIVYEETIFIIRSSANNVFLIVMFEPSMSLDLLTMSLNMALNDLKKLEKQEQHIIDTAEPEEETEEITSRDQLSAEELLNRSTGPLSKALNGMRSALVKIIGPIGKIVFADSVYSWLNENEPSYSSLSALIDIIALEIKDQARIDAFRKAAASFITN
jgi:hypothetical protein